MTQPINKVTIVLTEDRESQVLGCDVSGDLDLPGGEGLTPLGVAAAYMVAALSDQVKAVEFMERDDVEH